MFTISHATAADCSALLALREAAWQQERAVLPWAVVQAAQANYTRENAIRANWSDYVVLKQADQLWGMARLQANQIVDLAVLPDQQRHGCGSQLLQHLEAQLRSNGVSSCQCVLPEANLSASAFLRANAYNPVARFYQGEPALPVCCWQKSLEPFPTAPLADGLDFALYQHESRRTWQYVPTNHPVIYPTLGLVNEAGELAGKIKKLFRDKQGTISVADRAALQGELGDVLWYLTQICSVLELDLASVASGNLQKLFSRLARNQIQGSGDDR
jgi:ribosomal protein S18 acetylase RimI-like enzyme/NTP pyrophosphatase (non-canonical NTP hydrolase)